MLSAPRCPVTCTVYVLYTNHIISLFVTDRLPDITHIVFVVHGVGQVVDDTTIIRNTNIMRDNVQSILNKHFEGFQRESGQRTEFFPVEWRSSLRLDEGMVKHITPQRIMGLR